LDKTRTHQLGQYDEWNIIGQWIEKEKKLMHFSTQTHTQNMGQDNNSHTENVHNMVSGILRQWIEKREEMHALSIKTHTQTWNKTVIHMLRMYVHNVTSTILG
jgi:hypothetical protein